MINVAFVGFNYDTPRKTNDSCPPCFNRRLSRCCAHIIFQRDWGAPFKVNIQFNLRTFNTVILLGPVV